MTPFRNGLQVALSYLCICQGSRKAVNVVCITEFAGAAGAAVQARERKASGLSTPLFSSQSRKKHVVA